MADSLTAAVSEVALVEKSDPNFNYEDSRKYLEHIRYIFFCQLGPNSLLG